MDYLAGNVQLVIAIFEFYLTMITEKKVSIDLKRLINENHIYESGNIEYK